MRTSSRIDTCIESTQCKIAFAVAIQEYNQRKKPADDAEKRKGHLAELLCAQFGQEIEAKVCLDIIVKHVKHEVNDR